MTDEVRELLEQLRDEDNCNVLDYIDDAANMNESLSAELEQVKRERDTAMQDLIPSCSICVHNRGLKKWDDECIDCYAKSKWQWRGVSGKGDEQNDI